MTSQGRAASGVESAQRDPRAVGAVILGGAHGQHAKPQRGRPGAVWMHVARDLASAARHATAGRLGLADYCACWRRPLVLAAFAWDDPLPGVCELPLALYRGLTRRAPAVLRAGAGLTESACVAPKRS
jgi:predicted ATP-grasp superfamily ATP-dependent carboligase